MERIEESENSYFISYAVGVNSSNPQGDETALIVPLNEPIKYEGTIKWDKDTFFLILNGYWIKEYEACKSKKEQIELYRKNQEEHQGFWSDSLEELEKIQSV